MSLLTDKHYLQTSQYRDTSNLGARIYVHRRFSTSRQPWQRWVFDRLELPEKCDILEVGCGPGHLWLENKERIPIGWEVVLSDLTPGMVSTAQENLGCARFAYQVVDAQALPFADATFDAIIANHMLYHVADRWCVLHEMKRVLRPGGHLYAATNGRNHLAELRDLVAGFTPHADAPSAATAFGLQNGAAQLSAHFTGVKQHRQDNALVVTEAEPLLAYVMSMTCRGGLIQNWEALRRAVREQIAQQGAMHIQKESGMFVARKPHRRS